jgi:hypothetical protein
MDHKAAAFWATSGTVDTKNNACFPSFRIAMATIKVLLDPADKSTRVMLHTHASEIIS